MKSVILTMIVLSSSVFANEDLSIAGARWEAKTSGYKCAAYGEESKAPLDHSKINAKFEVIRTDRSLDNGLILATFDEDGSKCRYSAILLADNAASTIDLVQSKAYTLSGNSKCLVGKDVLDSSLLANDYLYWGHPHHLTIMMPAKSATSICGANATHIGLDFTVSGRIGN